MQSKQDKPWYRYSAPWLLMAGPAIVVVAGFITAWLAIKHDDALVVDDYYKQGKEINQDLARDQIAKDLGLQVDLMLGAGNQEIRLFLNGNTKLHQTAELTFKLMHPTLAGQDMALKAKQISGTNYQVNLPKPIHGKWHVSIEEPLQRWRLTGMWQSDQDKAITLKTAANQ
ncbi:FixH family protein [Chitinivorax sp. B]|uniref:FixH family protein n=1 Tax=Chitinivorax sp. B TaxID=2502235 RepID=UPI0014854577|nr:FixH family protein [Chitinivorax sp. B]